MKVYFLVVVLLIAGLLGGCASNNAVPGTDEPPKQVVLDFFKYWNGKDLDSLEKTLAPDRKGITWEFDKLTYVKMISIEEKTVTKETKNHKEFAVVFEVKFKDGTGSGLSDGQYSWNFILKKDGENSPWLIYDWGV